MCKEKEEVQLNLVGISKNISVTFTDRWRLDSGWEYGRVWRDAEKCYW